MWDTYEEEFFDCTAFLDAGSNYSLCSKRVANRLCLTGPEINVNLKTINHDTSNLTTFKTSFFIRGLNEAYTKRMSNVLVVDEIATFQQDNGCFTGSYTLPNDFPHTPVVAPAEIDLLIGLQDADLHIFTDLRKLPGSAMFAGKCSLGWLVFGCASNDNGLSATTDNTVHINAARVSNADLHNKMEKLFNHDFSDVKLKNDFLAHSVRDERALEIMRSSIKKVDGRYVVALPFVDDDVNLPNNYEMALNNLHHLGKRLSKADPSIRQKYHESMSNLLKDGHAVEVVDTNTNLDALVWYLIHFWVITSDKFRVVFNPSAKYKNCSLNSQLINGPDMNNNLQGVLMRFRQYPFAFSGDIKKMYYQVKVPEEQQDVFRFLWWRNGDPEDEVVQYKMTRHPFGAASSGNCAKFALNQTAEDNVVNACTEAVNTVKRSFYVDDGLKSVKDEDTLAVVINDVIRICDSGGFCFTKIRTNSKKVISLIPSDRVSQDRKNIKGDETPNTPVLGVSWDAEADVFVIVINVKDKPKTKRGILSQMLQIWQPLGHLQPFLLPIKILIQELQKLNLQWDIKIPDELVAVLQRWLQHLPALESVILPRPYSARTDALEIQLHCFSDASLKGYAASAYMCFSFEDGFSVAYVLGKCRVVPLRNCHTIPQLELTAATISLRMALTILAELELDIHSVTYWVDSETVLKYIANETARYKVFEANRIKFIRSNSDINSWKYVPTHLNPSDIGSRGLMPEEVDKLGPWINGPPYLLRPEEEWPQLLKSDKSNPAVIPLESLVSTVVVDESPIPVEKARKYPFLERFSTWQKLQRVFARFMRLQKWLKGRYSATSAHTPTFDESQTHLVTVHELHFSSLEILRLVQDEAFPDLATLIKTIGFEKAIKRIPQVGKLQTQSLRKMLPFVSDDGLIRVGGRLQNGIFPEEMKHPVILPARHHVTKLIIEHEHEKAQHFGGYRYVLAKTRLKYWILNGISAVKHYLKPCFVCREEKAEALNQIIAPLPADRLIPHRRIFTATALDYFGPITVLNKRSREKRWGCVFTCMATRAVHIEKVDSLSTTSFLNALFRFIY